MDPEFTIIGIWLGFFAIVALLTLVLRWLLSGPQTDKVTVRVKH